MGNAIDRAFSRRERGEPEELPRPADDEPVAETPPERARLIVAGSIDDKGTVEVNREGLTDSQAARRSSEIRAVARSFDGERVRGIGNADRLTLESEYARQHNVAVHSSHSSKERAPKELKKRTRPYYSREYTYYDNE